MRLFVQLDTNWPDHPKVISAGLEAAGLHAIALCLAKRFLTDGVLYRTQLIRYGATDELIDRLIDVGLLERVDTDRIAIHDWLDRNPSRQAIGGRVGARSGDGRRGNHKRWKHPGDFDSCPVCNPPNPQVSRPSDRGAIGGRVGGRSHRIARDIDIDIDRDNGTGIVAAFYEQAEINAERAEAMPPRPSADTGQAQVAMVRDAMRTTHSQPVKCETCDDHGWTYRAGTDIADPCPDCNPPIEHESNHAKRA